MGMVVHETPLIRAASPSRGWRWAALLVVVGTAVPGAGVASCGSPFAASATSDGGPEGGTEASPVADAQGDSSVDGGLASPFCEGLGKTARFCDDFVLEVLQHLL